MARILRIVASFFGDGFKVVGLVAPVLSIIFTLAKYFNAVSWLRQIDYAWAFLPISLWLLVAYVRRFLSSERDLSELQAKYNALIDEYPHSLRLESVNIHEERRADPNSPTPVVIERTAKFTLQWRNTIGRPISYNTLKTQVNGVILPIGNPNEVVSGNSVTTFYTASIPLPLSVPPNAKDVYQIVIEATYGRPDTEPTRRVEKVLMLTAYPDSGRNEFIYVLNKDDPIGVKR